MAQRLGNGCDSQGRKTSSRGTPCDDGSLASVGPVVGRTGCFERYQWKPALLPSWLFSHLRQALLIGLEYPCLTGIEVDHRLAMLL